MDTNKLAWKTCEQLGYIFVLQTFQSGNVQSIFFTFIYFVPH